MMDTDRFQGTVTFVSVGEQMPVSKKEVGECPVDAMMRVMDGRWKGTILWRLQDGPRRTSELKRSIPGITERMSSLVRLGPSCRRHRIVPFQRPSMTRIIASTGHSPTSFFETGISFSYTDKYDSTLKYVSTHLTL